ncbi:AAA family ATPase [Nocardia sp. NPDC058518]|uniref:AAA family ATPase n=1 Tax=Nocardia sp. NPDC058518 TaxID=3346534 RepID=UPI0036566648
MNAPSWHVFLGGGEPRPQAWDGVPKPMSARAFDGTPLDYTPAGAVPQTERRLGTEGIGAHQLRPADLDVINAAILCRRPLLVTGAPGLGKSSLAYLIARELALGPVLHWPITSRSTLGDGLYTYDAMRRFEEAQLTRRWWRDPRAGIADFVTLGPLGTALLPSHRPRVLLIDEIDKADADLPNDLLHVFEDGEYTINELRRIRAYRPQVSVVAHDAGRQVPITDGFVRCHAFPIVVMTSNGDREFPPAFLRRCLMLKLEEPDRDQLERLVASHFGSEVPREYDDIIATFLQRRADLGALPADRLLTALHVLTHAGGDATLDRQSLARTLLQPIGPGD